jgi:hypothetical protein
MTIYTNQYSSWERNDLIELYSRATSGESVKKLVRRFGRSPSSIQTALRKILAVQLTLHPRRDVAEALNTDIDYLKYYIAADDKYNIPLDYSEYHTGGVGCYAICMSSLIFAGLFYGVGVVSDYLTKTMV